MNTEVHRSLRNQFFAGIAWTLTSSVVLQVSRIAVVIILARLLTPRDFGLAAMVLVFSGLAFIFSDLSLGAALVQRSHLTEADRSTVFWTTLATGCGLTVLGVFSAGTVADFYGEPSVKPLFAAFSVCFALSSLGATQAALLTREMNFRSLQLRAMISTLLGAGVGIGAAAQGHGAWALIAQFVTTSAASAAILWFASKWRPRFVYSLRSLRELGGFGANVFFTRLLQTVNRNADNLIVGRFLGPAALGIYALSYNMMLLPLNRLVVPVQGVLFPTFARLRNDRQKMASVWIRANRMVAAMAMPAMLGLVVVAPELVQVMLGERWEPAVSVFQILAIVGLLFSINRLNSSLLQALDRTGTLLWYTALATATGVGAFILGTRWGVVGVAACYAISRALVIPLYTWLTAHAVGIQAREVWLGLRGISEASFLMMAGIFALRLALVHEGVHEAARLTLIVAAGVILFVPLCAWRAREVLEEVRHVRRGFRQRVRVTTPVPGK